MSKETWAFLMSLERSAPCVSRIVAWSGSIGPPCRHSYSSFRRGGWMPSAALYSYSYIGNLRVPLHSTHRGGALTRASLVFSLTTPPPHTHTHTHGMDTTPRLGYSAGTASTSPYTQNGVYPSQAPPAYTTVLRRVYPYSMRPVLLISTFISFLYLAIVAIASFRSTSWAHETTRLKLLDILIGALLLPAAIIEVIGFTAAYTCRLHLARLYSVASVAALALTVAADVLAIVEHYVVKGDLINGCTQDNTGRIGRVSSGWGGWFGGSTTGDDSTTPWTADQARAYCTSQWNRDGIWTIVW